MTTVMIESKTSMGTLIPEINALFNSDEPFSLGRLWLISHNDVADSFNVAVSLFGKGGCAHPDSLHLVYAKEFLRGPKTITEDDFHEMVGAIRAINSNPVAIVLEGSMITGNDPVVERNFVKTIQRKAVKENILFFIVDTMSPEAIPLKRIFKDDWLDIACCKDYNRIHRIVIYVDGSLLLDVEDSSGHPRLAKIEKWRGEKDFVNTDYNTSTNRIPVQNNSV